MIQGNKAFDDWWQSQFWVDAYTDDDKATALTAWNAATILAAPTDEKLRTLLAICTNAEIEGWHHVAITTLRAVIGGKPAELGNLS